MKRLIYIFMAAAIFVISTGTANAQMGKRHYFNAGWQFNSTLANDFVKSAQGYGAYFESGYYLTPFFAVGSFASFNTNNEYIPRQTYTYNDKSALTTDLDRSVYQVPFGITLRYRFFRAWLQPYTELKLGTEYSTQTTYMSTFVNRQTNWGFYVSPELGIALFPFRKADLGFQIAAYYSYSSNKNTSYGLNGLNNAGFKLGLAF